MLMKLFPGLYKVVEDEAHLVALFISEPAYSRRKPLEMDVLPRLLNPVNELFVIRKCFHDGFIGNINVFRVAAQCGPAERPLPFAEERADKFRDEAGNIERVSDTMGLGFAAYVVSVVESHRPLALEVQHRADVQDNRLLCHRNISRGVLVPHLKCRLIRKSGGDISVQSIVRAGLVGKEIGHDLPSRYLGNDVGSISQEPD